MDKCTPALLQGLAAVIEAAAQGRPRLDVVPLLPFASWSEGPCCPTLLKPLLCAVK